MPAALSPHSMASETMASMSTEAGTASLPAIGTVTDWEGCSEAGGRLSALGTVAWAADFDLFAL